MITKVDLESIPYYVVVSYLMNPYSILNCVGQTTTVFSNFLLAAFFYFLAKKQKLLTVLVLTLESQKNLYPFVLIIPAALYFSTGVKKRMANIFTTIGLFLGTVILVNYLSFLVLKDWSFLDATFGFM